MGKLVSNKMLEDYKQQYGLLRDYSEELLRSNPESAVKIDVENECDHPNGPIRQFKRIYICLASLKAGFKLCGREILGLDGCSMNGPFPGQILTAVGVDSNNGIYPVAYAIVEDETCSSWTWFLENLGKDLDLTCSSNFTFITHMQKGLMPALSKVFPSAEHRYCLRHIHKNMKKQWRGEMFKNMLWKCASATTVVQFDRAMDEIRKQDSSLYEWLKQIPPKSWARAHFSGRAKCDALLNNFCKVFNNKLVGVRDKPVITCLEYVRVYLMKRIVAVHKLIEKSEGPLTPSITKTFNAIKHEASEYTVLFAGNKKYQVSVNGPFTDQCVVDMELKTCACRKWELTGIPCKHAVAVIWDMLSKGLDVDIPEAWVSEVYWLDTWKKVYMYTVDPINGKERWIPSACPTTLTAPKHHTPVERPKKMRKMSFEELIRKETTTSCSKCKNKDHNSGSCKGESGSSSQDVSQGGPQPS